MRRVRPIIVLGPERSGTSAWAELICKWGAYPGSRDDLPEPDQLNPHGRWEYGPLWDLLEQIADFGAGVSWWEESFPAHVAGKAQDPDMRASAKALMGQMESAGQPWIWKDPALCHFLPFWRQIWQDPVYVIAVRHPYDIAHSWQQFARGNNRQPTSVRCNLLRWQCMITQVLIETAEATDKVFVEYEQLTQHPEQQARQLARFLATHYGGTATEATVTRMTAACDPALWRIRRGHQHGRGHLTSDQADLYQLLRAKAADANALARLPPMPATWRAIVTAAEADTNPA